MMLGRPSCTPVRSVLLSLAGLLLAGCSSTYLVTIKAPPEAQIYVNGRPAGRGPEARVKFDFSTNERVHLQVACQGYVPSWEPFTVETVPADLFKEVHLTPSRN